MKLPIFVGMMLLAASAYGQTAGFGPPTSTCAINDLYQDKNFLGVSWKCGPSANEWVPTPAFTPWGGSGGGSGVTLANTFASAGSFTFAHNLNSVFNQVACAVLSSGTYSAATFTYFPVDANDETVTVPSAGTYVCSFNSSGSYTPPANLPNFGDSTAEGSSNNLGSTYNAGSYFVAPATGTYATFHVYCSSISGANTSYIGVYPTSGGVVNGQTLIAQATYSCPTTGAWVTGTISVPVVSGRTYFFAAASTNSTFAVAWNTGTGSAAYATGSVPLPSTAPTYTAQTGSYSMYLSFP